MKSFSKWTIEEVEEEFGIIENMLGPEETPA